MCLRPGGQLVEAGSESARKDPLGSGPLEGNRLLRRSPSDAGAKSWGHSFGAES